jgi:hypothetical protein
MEHTMDLLLTIAVGVLATLLMDLWSIARRRLFGVPPPNFALVGRWIAHMGDGRFRHDAIAKAAPARQERSIGWAAHYVIGVAFAALLPLIWGVQWLHHPTLAPALIVGLGTLAAPFLLMQPGMGAGIAARRTPRPGAARLHSALSHGVFGLGLHAAASALGALALPH